MRPDKARQITDASRKNQEVAWKDRVAKSDLSDLKEIYRKIQEAAEKGYTALRYEVKRSAEKNPYGDSVPLLFNKDEWYRWNGEYEANHLAKAEALEKALSEKGYLVKFGGYHVFGVSFYPELTITWG